MRIFDQRAPTKLGGPPAGIAPAPGPFRRNHAIWTPTMSKCIEVAHYIAPNRRECPGETLQRASSVRPICCGSKFVQNPRAWESHEQFWKGVGRTCPVSRRSCPGGTP
eukprot:5773183-Pyramimonas_sp.AAC.1